MSVIERLRAMTNATNFAEGMVDVKSNASIEYLCDNLQGVKRSGSGWIALCPAHEDHSASLHFQRGVKRDVVMHCFAGCTFEAIVETCGLSAEMRRDVVEPEAKYPYDDAEGRPSYVVLRNPGKSFVQYSWNATGEVVRNVEGIKRLLYRLPEVLATAKSSGDVWVVEGERDVETLRGQGIVATTAPNGANVKWPLDLVEPLRGSRRVVIIADSDSPGRRAVRQRHEAISKVVDDVRWIDLAPSRDDGYDVSDYFADGGTLAELQCLADEASSERPLEPLVQPTGTDPGEKTGPAFFLKLYSDVSKRRDLTQSEKTVLSHIRRDVELSHDSKKNKGFRFDLSTRAIEEQTGMYRSKVRRAIKGLETKGFIEVKRTNGGRQKRNLYEIVMPMPPPKMGLKRVHLSPGEAAETDLLNGPILGPDMDPFWVPHINRIAESSNTLGENTSSISDIEEQLQRAKFDEKIPETSWPERLACGHALPWTDESGNVCCMGCDPPPGLHVIAPTAEAIRAFTVSVTPSTWPARPEDWK